MAGTLTIKQTGIQLPLNPAISILNLLQQNSIYIRHDCGGRMQCGTCRIKIYSGSEFIRKPSEQELNRLKAVGAGPDERLACQSYAYRDCVIDIINNSPKSATE